MTQLKVWLDKTNSNIHWTYYMNNLKKQLSYYCIQTTYIKDLHLLVYIFNLTLNYHN